MLDAFRYGKINKPLPHSPTEKSTRLAAFRYGENQHAPHAFRYRKNSTPIRKRWLSAHHRVARQRLKRNFEATIGTVVIIVVVKIVVIIFGARQKVGEFVAIGMQRILDIEKEIT